MLELLNLKVLMPVVLFWNVLWKIKLMFVLGIAKISLR